MYIKNDLPPDYPSSTNGGVTIHWHGFSQRDEPWQVQLHLSIGQDASLP